MKVMVSGAISWWGKSRLVYMPCGLKITAKEYLDTLKRFHIKDMKELFDGYGFEWQQVLCTHTHPTPMCCVFLTPWVMCVCVVCVIDRTMLPRTKQS
jgi:hypothetical protein